ncbi:hypothetical protein AKJ65_07060 [candidate division MSBL1 archaeon SCGC-AAA259E19]|uniref:Uncharacterized protein n=1 Tax=candidate division MSBL1 archaeon SCGC-AAA259E19 TaxID=1698264 RepID=A0A133UF66_9EURY|nr:hypothetical protein AKJ65_07060 [candidate division MSBL1 archaeon SCGC-AAA259E19]
MAAKARGHRTDNKVRLQDAALGWMREIDPEIVSVGYDNYPSRLAEPPRGLTERLIENLERFAEVERKTIRGWRGG